MWRHRRSKKPKTPDAERQSHQEGFSRFRDVFGLSRSHKQDAGQVKQETMNANGPPDGSLKTVQCGPIETVKTSEPIGETCTIAGAENSMPIPAEKPTSETDADGAVVHDIVRQAPRDLWQEAVDKLDLEQKSTLGLLDSAESSPRSAVSAIDDVVKKTEEKFAVYNTKGQVKRRDGTVLINIRENVKKILRGTLRVKDIIDAGVRFDPSGYASTAWGVISLGLQLAQNDVDRIDGVLSASAFLTDIMCRYANITANYRDQTVQDVDHLENHIVKVYVAVLEYTAKVRSNHSMGVGSRILDTFYALDKAPLQELREAITDADPSMNNWRELIEHEYRIKEAAVIEAKVEDVLQKVQNASAKLNVLLSAEQQRQLTELINWLTTMSTASKHTSKIKDRNPNTAEWIFSHDEYLSWLNGPDDSKCVLWMHGPYGSGKSVLFANVINSVLHNQDSNISRLCAYWYFDSGTSANDTNAGLRSIIAQLVGSSPGLPKVLEELKKLKEANNIPNREPSKENLLNVLSTVVEELIPQSEVILAFDALDECPDRAELLDVIATLTETGCGVKIFVTSRPEEDIQRKIGSIATGVVSILDKTQDDVEHFVMTELEGSAFAVYGEHIHNAIKAKLLESSDRRFRLIALQLQELKECYDTAMIHETLNDLPESIEEAYRKALLKISNNRRKVPKLRALLGWIFVAKRKLTLEEVGSALSIEFPEKLLSDCPSCLIRITEEEEVGWTLFPYPGGYRTVEFDHSSVREYLASGRLQTAVDKNLSQYYVDASEANTNAAMRCLDIVLAQNEHSSLEISAEEEPMLSYAARYWIAHARPASTDSMESSEPLRHPLVEDKIEHLFSEAYDNSRLNWIRVHDPEEPDGYPDLLRPWKECGSPLYYAALLGLERIVDPLLKRGAQIISTGGALDNAFIAAGLHGQVGCLRRMSQTGYAPSAPIVYQILRGVRWNADAVLSVVLGHDFMNNPVGDERKTLKTDRIVEGALSNEWSAISLIDAIAVPGLSLEITPGIERAARENFRQGEDALHLLFQRLGNLSITEGTLAAVAKYHSPKVVRKALYGVPDSAVTARVMLGTARNESYCKEAFGILLDHLECQFKITEMLKSMLWAGWWPDAKLLDTLIRRGGEEIPITIELLKDIAMYCDGKTMKLALDRAKHVRITEDTAVAAAKTNPYGPEVMRVLLDCHQRDFEVTWPVLEAASLNKKNVLDLIAMLINDSESNELVISSFTLQNLDNDMELAAAVVKVFLQNGDRIQFAYDAVQLAVQVFNADVLKLLLAHPNFASISISEDIIVNTASWLGADSNDMVRLLLGEYIAQGLPVTDRIIRAIVESLDEEVLKWLLDLHAAPVSDIPGLFISIIRNQHQGPHSLELFLQYECADIAINDETIRNSANNFLHAHEMTHRLLSLERARFDITEVAVAEVASKLDGEIMSLILDRWERSEHLPGIVLENAFRNSQHCIDVVKVLLDRYGQDTPLTSDIVSVAAGNRICGYELMSILLDHDKCLPLTDAVMVRVAENATCGLDILNLILRLRPRDFVVSTSVLVAVGCNEEHGLEMMVAILSNRRDDIRISPKVLACAARNCGNGGAMVRLLLAQPESHSLLTEGVLHGAVSNYSCAAEVLTLLLSDQQWDYIPLTVDVMSAIDTAPKLAALLRSLPPDCPISPSMVDAVIKNDDRGARMTRLLLEHRGTDVQVTKELIEAALSNFYPGDDVIRLLLRRRGDSFPVTDEIVVAMTRFGNADLITEFLDMRGAAVTISAAVLEAGMKNDSATDVEDVLLQHQPDIPITEELVIQAVQNGDAGPGLINAFLEQRGNAVPVTDAVVVATANAPRGGAETLSLLLEKRSHDITLTENFVRQFSWNCLTEKYKVLVCMLRGLSPQSRITEGATAALAAEFSADELGLLLDGRERQVPVTARVILAAIQNVERKDELVQLLLKYRPDPIVDEDIIMAIVTSCSVEVIGLLLEQHGTEISITEEMVLAAAESARDGVLQLLLSHVSYDLPISARIVMAVARRGSGETMSFLLGCRGSEVTVTEPMINAAVTENIHHGQEVISIILDQRADHLQMDGPIFLDMVRRFDARIIHRLYTYLGTDVATARTIIAAAATNEQYGDNILKTLIAKNVLAGPEVLAELARQCNGEVIRYMLQEQGENGQIPEEVIRAATENKNCGEEVMLLLLEERGSDIPLTESILIDIVDRFDATVISTLLDERAKDVVLTEGVVMAALNSKHYPEVMEILLHKWPQDIPLTEPIVRAIIDGLHTTATAPTDDGEISYVEEDEEEEEKEEEPDLEPKDHRYWQALLPVMLDRCDENVCFNEDVILKCASKYTRDFTERLFQKRGKNIAITEKLIMAVIRNNKNAEEVMIVILAQAERFPVTETTVAAIARSCSARVLDSLLDRQNEDLLLTEKVLVAAAAKPGHGAEIMRRLIELSNTPISQRVVRAAASNECSGARIMDLILEQRGLDVPITPDVLHLAIWSRDMELLSVLLRHRHHHFPITVTLVERCNENQMMTVLRRREHYSDITAQAVAAIAGTFDESIMKVLLDVYGPDIPITEDVLTAAATNSRRGSEVISLLVHRQGTRLPVTDSSLETMLRSSEDISEVLQLHFQQLEDITLTHEMVRLVAGNTLRGRELIALLFDHFQMELPITERILKAAAENHHDGLGMLVFLLKKWGDDLPITEGVVIAAARNMSGRDIIDLFQQHRNIPITSRILESAAANPWVATDLVSVLLSQDGSEGIITQVVVSAAIQNRKQVKTLLPILIRSRKRQGQVVVTKQMLEEASSASYEAMTALLPFVPDDLNISERILLNMMQCDRRDASLTRMLLDLRGNRIPPITAAMVRVARGCDRLFHDRTEILKLLFQHRCDGFHVTEDLLIETVKGFDEQVVTILLRGENVQALVTSAVFEAVLENTNFAEQILQALAELRIQIPVTERGLQVAARNLKTREGVMDFLLRNCPREVCITEDVIKAAVSNEWLAGAMLRLIARHAGRKIIISEDVLLAATSNDCFGEEAMDLLLDHAGVAEDIPITKRVTYAAAGNSSSGSHIMTRFLKLKGIDYMRPLLTENVLTKAASNRGEGCNIVRLLLRSGLDISVTSETLKAAARNPTDGQKILALLLNYPGNCVPITSIQELLEAAAESPAGTGIARILLERHDGDNEARITETAMKAAASNVDAGADLVALFLEQDVVMTDVVTENVLKAAAENDGDGQGEVIMAHLFNHGADSIVITTEVVEVAAANPRTEVLTFLLNEMGEKLPLSVSVLKVALNSLRAVAKLELLFPWIEQGDISILEDFRSTAHLGPHDLHGKLLFFIRQWGKYFVITEETAKAVVSQIFRSDKLLSILFHHQGRDLPITEEVVIAAAGNSFGADSLIAMLLDERGEDLPITSNVLNAAIRNDTHGLAVLRRIYMERREDFHMSLTEDVLKTAAELCAPAFRFFIEYHWIGRTRYPG